MIAKIRSRRLDKNGKHLLLYRGYTNTGLSGDGWRRHVERKATPRVTRNVYLTVRRKDLPSPILPESDDEKTATATKSPKQEDHEIGRYVNAKA